MSKLAALGPHGTFSELAAERYSQEQGEKSDVILYPTITRVFQAIGRECERGIIPLENMLEGHVQLPLDLLLISDLSIIYELLLPVRFSFIATVKDLAEVEKVYAQFVTQGQCRKFLDSLSPHVKIITTESNGTSIGQLQKNIRGEAAIVPAHALTGNEYGLVMHDITDFPNNQTRFIILSREPAGYDAGHDYKTSFVILDVADRSGSLFTILREFASRNINLSSLMSHTTKVELGKYHFFIDAEGRYPEDERLGSALESIAASAKVKLLGSYPKARR